MIGKGGGRREGKGKRQMEERREEWIGEKERGGRGREKERW